MGIKHLKITKKDYFFKKIVNNDKFKYENESGKLFPEKNSKIKKF